MTVSAVKPLAEYTGNGSITQYFWGWQMLPESIIEVRVNDVRVTNYTENVGNIVFFSPPLNGDAVVIFRRTPVWMPEDYAFARGFKSEKTELSLDRAYMIAQEFEAGYVGTANISAELQAAGILVISERGADAQINLWEASGGTVPPPSVPDASIIWAGNRIEVNNSSNNPLSIASIIFWPNAQSGPLGQANATYTENFINRTAGWLNFEFPQPGAYWMRVNDTGAASYIDPGMVFTITDSAGAQRAFGDEFDPRNGEIKIATTTAVPPVVSFIELNVEISKDLNGSPDGAWASRIVFIALEYFA